MGHILVKFPRELPIEELGKVIGLEKIKELPSAYGTVHVQYLGYLGHQEVVFSRELVENFPYWLDYGIPLTMAEIFLLRLRHGNL